MNINRRIAKSIAVAALVYIVLISLQRTNAQSPSEQTPATSEKETDASVRAKPTANQISGSDPD